MRQDDRRYLVISADCHGGAALTEYRDYLESSYWDDFDRWAASYEMPYEDLKGEEGSRNWDTNRRRRDLEADGIVAEVMYPNTVPPFFSTSSLASSQAAPENSADFRRRWAGLKAHNRWLAEFCADSKGRRAGVFQIMLHDIGEAVQEIRWAAGAGFRGGLLLPGAPPGSGLPPLYYHEYYDPLWAACAELGIPVNCHSGSAGPRTGSRPADNVFFLLEMKWWDIRTLRHVILGGVLERHPGLRMIFTEEGVGWIPAELKSLDRVFESMYGTSGGAELTYRGSQAIDGLSLRPSEYWDRQCYVGASFMHPSEAAVRGSVGVKKIMWGSDYPHVESSFPYSKAAIQFGLAGVAETDAEQMLGGNAARVYGFSLGDLRPIADRVGPRRAEVTGGIDPSLLPADAAKCPAFAGALSGSGTMHMGDNRKSVAKQPRDSI
jgi:predicted TIM-barrel fold metal-dependent hydrolase